MRNPQGRRRGAVAPRYLTDEEEGALKGALGPKEREAVTMVLLTGCRLRVDPVVWHRVVTATGISDLRQADLRHTFARRQLVAGVTPAEVALQLGHCPTEGGVQP